MPFSVPAVVKPFPDYKWRWMEVTPVETFNRVDLLLGVTRAIMRCEGQSASSPAFNQELARVQADLLPNGTDPQITNPDGARNVLRRQGRYWRGLGILSSGSARALRLTEYGRRFALGEVTPDDFIKKTINDHQLPNLLIDSADTVLAWQRAGLGIAPLQILLAVMVELGKGEPGAAYLTTEELGRVVVPLTLHDKNPEYLAEAVRAYRANPEPFDALPDCVTGSNDWRMLREHLLFLAGGGVVKSVGGATNRKERFALVAEALQVALKVNQESVANQNDQVGAFTIDMVNESVNVIMTVERNKRNVQVVSRPTQSKFRKDVLENCNSACVITGETFSSVLVACHIHEVWENGSDHLSNGIMLRADLHVLFDTHKLRIDADGTLVLAPDVADSPTYSKLPKIANLPPNLNQEALRRRFLYGKVTL